MPKPPSSKTGRPQERDRYSGSNAPPVSPEIAIASASISVTSADGVAISPRLMRESSLSSRHVLISASILFASANAASGSAAVISQTVPIR